MDVAVSLRLGEHEAAWFWHVDVVNRGTVSVEVDLVFAQDVALAPLGAVRTNEYYVSQYLDLTPVPVPGHGVAIGVRQNMPGPTPWVLVGCLGTADRWATDALQLTGRGRVDGAPWPGLAADLPAKRFQGEHSVAILQTAPIVLQPGGRHVDGFYGLYRADHQAATTAADVSSARAALDDPAATAPQHRPADDPARVTEHRSVFGTSPTLSCRPLSVDQLNRLAGAGRLELETVDDDELLSFFTADGAQVVTAAKQARVLRPHGQLFRSGSTLLPDESSVCVTVWMDGTFCSHLTQGHVSLGAITSPRRSYLGLAPAHGLRLFVDSGSGWTLLGTPSAWRVALDGATWWYAHAGGLLQVTTTVSPDRHQVDLAVDVIDGDPVTVLAAVHVPWLDPDGPPGAVTVGTDSLSVAPPPGSTTAGLYPDASVELSWSPGTAPVVGDDADLFVDGRSRGLAWVTLRTAATTDWRLALTPHLVPPSPDQAATADFWSSTTGAIALTAPDTAPGRELGRIAKVVPWFTHDALVHYLSPRGLEQYTGGAWGTRDVSQGPVGLLLALGAHRELRSLLLLIMRAQNQRGDWPQAFDFLDRHRSDGQSGGQSGAHGDVVYWPLLALGQYLAATGDHTILAEPVPFTADTGPTPSAPLTDHVRAALDHVDTTMITATSMPAYGHGDWNDSLQPADPDLAARLCSTWTVVLQTHALRTLGHQLTQIESTPDLGERAVRTADAGVADLRRLLLVDGVLAGYGLFGAQGAADDAEEAVEPLLHPLDRRTGLTYSILPMIHAIAGDLLTPAEATQHLQLIHDHLLGPDGARLFDRPVSYTGGPMTLFQRAEASTFFGREIGIMYMHAHLRYAEALARVGDGPGLLHALALAQPIGLTDRVASARPRQSTCYYSSSDAAFTDRYDAEDRYRGIFDASVPLEGGWRVYSSGPALFLQLLVQCLLGLRPRAGELELDPVLDPELDGLVAQVRLAGELRTVRFVVGARGHGVASVRVGGTEVATTPLANPYREPGVSIRMLDLTAAAVGEDAVVEITTR